jgi:integrase
MAHTTSSPKYRRQRSATADRAFVELNGVRQYLGVYNSAESREAFHRAVAEWTANGRRLQISLEQITITNLLARFWDHAQVYYVKPDGTQTSEVSNFKRVMAVLRRHYGTTLAGEFGPKKLKALRQSMIDLGWVRDSINKNIGRVKMIFRWGVAEELIEAPVYQALLAVPGLKRGRCTAKESDAVRPVAETDVEKVKPYVCSQVWSIIQMQLLTAARSGEIIMMRPCDIDRSNPIWVYTPLDHKTAHHGRDRRIFIGPRARAVLEPFLLNRKVTDYIFRADEGAKEHIRRRNQARVTPLARGNRPGTNRVGEPLIKPGERYRVDSYRRAIARACQRAKIPTWKPHQLRHTAATLIRREHRVEAAQLLLGHANVKVTELYAELDDKKAIAVAGTIG